MSPGGLIAAQEAYWYAAYAVALWAVAAIIALRYGRQLTGN